MSVPVFVACVDIFLLRLFIPVYCFCMPVSAHVKPSFIQYETVTVPDITTPDFGGQDAVQDFLIDFQGAHVCLSPNSHIASTLRLFSDIHAVTDELVMESKSGDIFLTPIYSRDTVIRDSNVILDFAFPNSGKDFSQRVSGAPPYSVDLEKIFPSDEHFSPDDLQKFFDALLPQLRPAHSVTLSGTIPLIPAFFSAAFLREAADELRYEGIGKDTIQVFSI